MKAASRTGLLLLMGLFGGWGLGRVVSGTLALVPQPEPEAEWTTVSGTLPADLNVADGHAGALVLLVDAHDVEYCEDLGRQVRELVHQQVGPREIRFEVWVPQAVDVSAVRSFAARERLKVDLVHFVDLAGVLGEQEPMQTPAMLAIDQVGEFKGIQYLNRLKLVRTVAFADLLDASAVWDFGARASAAPQQGGQRTLEEVPEF